MVIFILCCHQTTLLSMFQTMITGQLRLSLKPPRKYGLLIFLMEPVLILRKLPIIGFGQFEVEINPFQMREKFMHNIKISNIRYLILSLILILICGSVLAANIDPDSTGQVYAYGENIGWINLNPSKGPGVAITDSAVSGYAWSENAGWIKFDPNNGGVSNDGVGNLSGYAWGENIGWISFSCENTSSCGTVDYGVYIDPATGIFEGEAWAENVGWIKFDYTGYLTFGVRTAWSTDSDGDGMLDSWEQQIVIDNTGDNINSIADVYSDDDYDGDGFNNLREYLADTDPVNMDSYPQTGYLPPINLLLLDE